MKQSRTAALSTCSVVLGMFVLAVLGHLERQRQGAEIRVRLSRETICLYKTTLPTLSGKQPLTFQAKKFDSTCTELRNPEQPSTVMILYALSPFLRFPLQPGPCHCHPNRPCESRLVPSESQSWIPEATAAVIPLIPSAVGSPGFTPLHLHSCTLLHLCVCAGILLVVSFVRLSVLCPPDLVAELRPAVNVSSEPTPALVPESPTSAPG